MSRFTSLSTDLKQYLLVTGNYWSFTLTDGALRMLVVLYFYQLGYQPLEIAMLFIFYEIFGVVTNLLGGWLGARLGLNKTMNIGLFLQIAALSMLLVPAAWLSVPWVMAAQALSGVAKDLNKMSAKSAIKLLIPAAQEGQLYKWVAILTGSKNAMKGAGFFLGGLLLYVVGFQGAVLGMAACLSLVWLVSLILLKRDLGKRKNKPKFTEIFSKSPAINYLSAARLCLFASRDVWFVVALPVYLSSEFHWSHWTVGSYLAVWVIFYGFVQGLAPTFTRDSVAISGAKTAARWALFLLAIPALIASTLSMFGSSVLTITLGLLLYGALFAVNSSLHSFLIVNIADREDVSLDVGFYYMANAMGRLLGTVLSGWVFQAFGFAACLWVSFALIMASFIAAKAMHPHFPTRPIEHETNKTIT